MTALALFLALALQATPLPSPAITATPLPSPAATAAPSPAPSATPLPLAASVTAVNLQPAQAQTITVANATGTLAANLSAPIATVTLDQTTHALTITAGQQTGNATLTLTDQAGNTITIPVRVALPAGSIPAQLALQITGNPVDPVWLQQRVQSLVLKSLTLQPGITAQNVQIAPVTLPTLLNPGASAAIPVSVRIAGGAQYLDVNATADVSLDNVVVAPFQPPLLLYDDDPERITADGVLYRAQINPGQPARLYYYHQNVGQTRELLVTFTPAGNQSAVVQLIDASAGPNEDVMSVGHAVSRDFLVEKPRNEGLVENIGAGLAPFIADAFAPMQPIDGAAGSIGIRVISGGPVTVTVLAAAPNATQADIANYLNAPKLPGDGHKRTGVFDISTFGQQTLAYTVGGPDASMQYGASTPPLADTASGGRNFGAYGVIETFTFDVDNPTNQPVQLYFYERPMGGVVRSSFLVNGQLAQVGCARVSNRYQIGDPYVANPGTSTVVVQTMTDGGSNYPLEIGLTATPPQPTVPPISAPDGCFPKPSASPAAQP